VSRKKTATGVVLRALFAEEMKPRIAVGGR
jgi:hypothetical protein